MSYYRVCPECGALLDPGEHCSCEQRQEEAGERQSGGKEKAVSVVGHQDGR